MKPRRWGAGIAGLLLVLISVWQMRGAAQGLDITTVRSTTVPVTIVAPQAPKRELRPVVLIGHGFAASSVVMRGFALSLAHAGYAVVMWDFDGHGANPHSLPTSTRADALLVNAENALAEAEARGLGKADQVAILGHSMGSGVALAFGQAHPETAATIGVSPVERAVTPTLPRNLLLMAGSLEPPFLRNAEERLAEAGGPGGDPMAGTARQLLVVPGVEHLSILFAPAAHAGARDWLDATFGPQPGATAYTDRRVVWYGFGMIGVLLVAISIAPLVAEPTSARPSRSPSSLGPGRRVAALVGGSVGGTVLLWLASSAGLALRNLLGLLVGGYLLIWFGVAGILTLWLLRLSSVRGGAKEGMRLRPPTRPPTRRAVLRGLLVFAALWLGVGLMGQSVWLPWLLIPKRLLLWPLGGLLLLPWFLAAGKMAEDTSIAGRFGWWFVHSATLAGSIFLALQLSPELGFLILILPLFPIVLGFHALIVSEYRGSWPFALSGALFVSWLLIAVFPLQ